MPVPEDSIPPIPDLGPDEQAYILTGVERFAIRDARLIVSLVRSGQLDEAYELASQTDGNFLDDLEPLAERVKHGDRVAFRKISEWCARLEQQKSDED